MRKGAGVFTKVLIIDDDQAAFEALRSKLVRDPLDDDREMYFVEHARTVEQAKQMDAVEVHDVYIIDHSHRDSGSGNAGIGYVRHLLRKQKHPAIILYGGEDEILLNPEIMDWISRNELVFLHEDEIEVEDLRLAISDMLGYRYRLLIVEDDPEDVGLIQHYLNLDTRHRFECECAAGLEEARALLEDWSRYDAMLLDYRLGVDRGIEIADELHRQGHPLPVVLLTGDTSICMDRRAMRLLGRRSMGFLSKGHLGTAELVKSLRQVGGLKRS